MSSKDVSWSYPFRERYRDIFERHVDMPGDVYDFSRPKKLHANKLGRKKYHRHFFDGDGKVKSDESSVFLENGLITIVRRHFKKPLPSKEYLQLARQSSAAAIRERIMRYDVTMPDYPSYPDFIQNALTDVFNRIFPPSQRLLDISPQAFLTQKVSALNLYLQTINDIDEWDRMAEIPADNRLKDIPRYQWAAIPWIRRRDKKFDPEYTEIDGVQHVLSERRFFLGDNSVAIRIRKIFKRPLHVEEYEEYKCSHKKTLLRKREEEQAASVLFDDPVEPLDLLECVDEIQYFPLFLVTPYKAEEFNPDLWPHPYIGRNIMRETDRDTEGETDTVLSRDFENAAHGAFRSTRDSLGLSLAMKELKRLPPHKISLGVNHFYHMANAARNMAMEEHDRIGFDLY